MTESDFRILPASYKADGAAIRSVRFAVFVDEQAVPASLEIDERDPHCFHVLAVDAGDAPIGTARIDVADNARVGRMAVLAAFRNRGVGSAMLDALHAYARAHECIEVWCHAQTAARQFYERAGYVAQGTVFEEAGIEHITMRCRFRQ